MSLADKKAPSDRQPAVVFWSEIHVHSIPFHSKLVTRSARETAAAVHECERHQELEDRTHNQYSGYRAYSQQHNSAMFKSLVGASRVASRIALRNTQCATPLYRGAAIANQFRFYSSAPELTKEIISARIIDLLESYSKTAKGVTITPETSFTKDLGYDSFDVVEVIMEMEYEFSILIPDKEADEIKTVGQAIDFISHQSDAC